MRIDRRRFLGASAGVTATLGMTAEWAWPKHSVSYRRPRSAVAVLNAEEYSEKIEALLLDGLRLFRLQVLGRSVLLKPNLVEDLPGPVNTNSSLIGAAARCFLLYVDKTPLCPLNSNLRFPAPSLPRPTLRHVTTVDLCFL
jgi:hypothetical protein